MAYTNTGAVVTAPTFRMTLPQSDGFCNVPPSEFTTVPQTGVTYSQALVAGPSGTNLSVLQAAAGASAATAIVHLDLSDFMLRSTTGKGVSVTGVTLVYTVTGGALTAGPSVTAVSQTAAAPGTTASAPTATLNVGGTVTSNPATPPTAVPTAGRFYTVSYSFATPIVLNAPLSRVYLEISAGLPANGTFALYMASVSYQWSPL